ncbi:hypothetical protein C0W80_05365 [Photobacterium leiognathi subsp. mandapamensis]|uniref:hypothetical protein n=1 Tax=Photobacterium leiognathi TaxID=553611 RepID=UPI000D1714D1|nr:hypothetical protein [Photobacterium leiognathi]PSV03604.1 hypothetical protein C0W80_05365 [Photobacterium leiognathi subsp. mandapamensis]
MALLTTFYWQFTLPIPHTSFITQANTIAMHLIAKHLLRVLTVKKYCPHCQKALDVPAMSAYDEHFDCPHCGIALMHNEKDIFIYAIVFIVAITVPLIALFNINSFIAIAIALVGYRLLRPHFFEPRFRIKHVSE